MSAIIYLFFHKEFAAWELLGYFLCGIAVGIKWVQNDNKKDES